MMPSNATMISSKTSSYKWTKLLCLRIKKGKQKVYVDFNLIWRFRHSEVQVTDFLFLNRDYLDLIFVPFFRHNVRFTRILYLLTFPLELTFVKKQRHRSYSLNSTSLTDQTPSVYCRWLPSNLSIKVLTFGSCWPDSLHWSWQLCFPNRFCSKIFLPLLPSTFSPIVFALNSNES